MDFTHGPNEKYQFLVFLWFFQNGHIQATPTDGCQVKNTSWQSGEFVWLGRVSNFMHAYCIVCLDCVTIQKCPLGIRQWVLHEQISIGRLHKACQGGNLQQYVTFTYHLSWLANTCTWYVEYAYKIVSHTILCRKMR